MAAKSEPYSVLAGFYNEFQHDAIDYQAWFAQLKEIINKYGYTSLEQAKILDLGCGTGVFTGLFAKEGACVTGVDKSAAMLAIAEASCRKYGRKTIFIQQDIKRLSVPCKYDFAVSCCDTFNYLLHPATLTAVLARVKKQIRPGGFLLFDLKTPLYYRRLPKGCWGGVTKHAAYLCETAYQTQTRTAEQYLTIFQSRADGGYRRSEESHSQRAYGKTEAVKALGAAGFSAHSVYNLQGHPGRLLFAADN